MKTRHGRRAKCLFVGFQVLMIGALLSLNAQQRSEKPNLTGQILDTDSLLIENARVFIYTAHPKEGPAYLCPSCYLDCRKDGVSDLEGRFEINSLDSTLQFRILVVAEGYVPKFVQGVDPAQGPVSVRLDKLDYSEVPPARQIRGRVVATDGKPIVGATATVDGWADSGEGFIWGPAESVLVTPVAVTDLSGHFVLVTRGELRKVTLEIDDRNHANRQFHEVKPGEEPRDYALEIGASVVGRLIYNGAPLAGKMITISSKNRGMGSNFTKESVATDPEGKFTFYNLPSDLEYNLSAEMDSIRDLGITPLQAVTGLKDAKLHRANDLIIKPGLSVRGTVKLTDGKPIPKDSVIFLNHDSIWEGQHQTLPADGRFSFEGLHPGKVRCVLRVPGYRLAQRNRSFNDMNGGELLASLSHSKTNLELLLEAGSWDINGNGLHSGLPWEHSAQRQPLGGIEPLTADEIGARARIQVVDAQSQAVIPFYRVATGWQFKGETKPAWHLHQENIVSNAEPYSIVWEKRQAPPFLRVIADGYSPESIKISSDQEQTLRVKLKKGQPVRGTILDP